MDHMLILLNDRTFIAELWGYWKTDLEKFCSDNGFYVDYEHEQSQVYNDAGGFALKDASGFIWPSDCELYVRINNRPDNYESLKR